MRRAVCPGSFDPPTLGHLDIIERAAMLFDEVVVAIGNNAAKAGFFSADERRELLQRACAEWSGVRIALFEGLLVDFCRDNEVDVIVKGVRGAADFDYELQMAQLNTRLSGVETVFLPTAAHWSYVSSSRVREIAGLGGDVTPFLSAEIAERTRVRARQGR